MNSTPSGERKFLALVDENRNKILRVCRAYAWNPTDQDDLYQEILFQIWRSLPDIREEQFANTWLYRVAINTAISFIRKRSTGSHRIIHLEQTELTRTIEARQPIDADSAERITGLYNAIYRLDPVEKALMTLFLEDFTYEQIAEATGINANNVGVLLHRAKKKIANLMKEATSK